MADKPAEFLLFDFLEAAFTAAVEGDTFFDIDLHDTIYQKISKRRGVRISDATSEMSPTSDDVRDFNTQLQIVCFCKVEGKDKKQRQDAMTNVWTLAQAVYALITGDVSLGGRVCDVLIDTSARGYDVYDGNPYAVAIIPITIDPAEGS